MTGQFDGTTLADDDHCLVDKRPRNPILSVAHEASGIGTEMFTVILANWGGIQ